MPLGIGKKKSRGLRSDKTWSKLNEDDQNLCTENNEITENQSQKSPQQYSNGLLENNNCKDASYSQGDDSRALKTKLAFQCQQAHGSPVGIITGFTNVKELYQKIADCYNLDISEILFCTLNTHKLDMSKLLGGQIGLEDFIFVHIKGQPKEIEVTKTDEALGLTITDNGNGYSFIKRIKEYSTMDKEELADVGDHIEKLDGKSLVGSRHFEIARMLKEIPKGQSFVLRLIEPLKSGFSFIGPQKSKGYKAPSISSGMKTLRLPKKGNKATVEMANEVEDLAVESINSMLESYLGIHDTDLARSIWEIGSVLENTQDFAEKIDQSDLSEFGFDDEFLFDLWGKITDARQGRLKQSEDLVEKL